MEEKKYKKISYIVIITLLIILSVIAYNVYQEVFNKEIKVLEKSYYYFDNYGFHTTNNYNGSKIIPIRSTSELDKLVKFFEQEIQSTNSVFKYNNGLVDKQKIERNLNELYSMRAAYNDNFFEDKSLLVLLYTDGKDNICIVKSPSAVKINFHYFHDDIVPNLTFKISAITVQKADIIGVNNFIKVDVYDTNANLIIKLVWVVLLICAILLAIYVYKKITRKDTYIIKVTLLVALFILILLIITQLINVMLNGSIQPNTDNDEYPHEFIEPNTDNDEYPQVKKPIIYLYPEKETNVSVKLLKPEKLTHTYPKYNDSWNVLAKPNGDLVDLSTGRSLYSLYWEGNNTEGSNMSEGFVVKGSETIKFLEDKLAILGLTEREANEFIIYWLPQLENNKCNFIRFQSIEEINNNMGLDIKPQPDSIIRIMMEFKPLNEYIEVKEQKLITPQRKGFVAVEWGGTQVK